MLFRSHCLECQNRTSASLIYSILNALSTKGAISINFINKREQCIQVTFKLWTHFPIINFFRDRTSRLDWLSPAWEIWSFQGVSEANACDFLHRVFLSKVEDSCPGFSKSGQHCTFKCSLYVPPP